MSDDILTPGAFVLDGPDEPAGTTAADVPAPAPEPVATPATTPEPVATPAVAAPVEPDEPALPEPRDEQERGIYGEVTRLRAKVREAKQSEQQTKQAAAEVAAFAKRFQQQLQQLPLDRQQQILAELDGRVQPQATTPAAPAKPDGPSDDELTQIASEYGLVNVSTQQWDLEAAKKIHTRITKQVRSTVEAALAPLHQERTNEKAQHLTAQAYQVAQQYGVPPEVAQEALATMTPEQAATPQGVLGAIVGAAGVHYLRQQQLQRSTGAVTAPAAAPPPPPPVAVPRPQFTEAPTRPTAPLSLSRAEQIAARAVGMSQKQHAANVAAMGTVKVTKGGGYILEDSDE